MTEKSKNKIEELKAELLKNTKEWKSSKFNKLKNRQIYWTWTQEIHTIKHVCPMTYRVWFTEFFNGWSKDTNATSEMYLIPINKT